MGCEKCREEFRVKNFKLHMDRPAGLITFEWPVPQVVYVLWRLLAMGFFVGTLIYHLVVGFSYQFFTNWGFVILTIQTVTHFIVCMIYTFHPTLRILEGNTPYATEIVSNVNISQAPLSSNGVKLAHDSPDEVAASTPVTPRALQFLWVWTEVAFTTALIVSIVYYALIFGGGSSNFDEYSVHMFNAGYVIVDIWLTKLQFRLYHMMYELLYLIIYLIFSIVYYKLTGLSIYDLLDWGSPATAAGWCIAILVLAVLIFVLLFGVATLRSFIQVKCCPRRWNALPEGNSVAPAEEARIT